MSTHCCYSIRMPSLALGLAILFFLAMLPGARPSSEGDGGSWWGQLTGGGGGCNSAAFERATNELNRKLDVAQKTLDEVNNRVAVLLVGQNDQKAAHERHVANVTSTLAQLTGTNYGFGFTWNPVEWIVTQGSLGGIMSTIYSLWYGAWSDATRTYSVVSAAQLFLLVCQNFAGPAGKGYALVVGLVCVVFRVLSFLWSQWGVISGTAHAARGHVVYVVKKGKSFAKKVSHAGQVLIAADEDSGDDEYETQQTTDTDFVPQADAPAYEAPAPSTYLQGRPMQQQPAVAQNHPCCSAASQPPSLPDPDTQPRGACSHRRPRPRVLQATVNGKVLRSR